MGIAVGAGALLVGGKIITLLFSFVWYWYFFVAGGLVILGGKRSTCRSEEMGGEKLESIYLETCQRNVRLCG